MFGLNDDNQQSNDDPAMLDNVKQLASEPASQVEPQQPTAVAPVTPTTNDSSTINPVAPITTDSTPSEPTVQPDSTDPAPVEDNSGPGHAEIAEGFSSQPMPEPTSGGVSPSELFGAQDSSDDTATSSQVADDSAAVSQNDTPAIQSTSTPIEPAQNDVSAPPAPSVMTADESNATTSVPGDVNHDQLASLKQEALGHLEGLSDHIDGDPEEVFKTTMQLIQANDNHTLLEKALKAAKEIKDDKVRAQAMLDIVNEINYFSQINSTENPTE